MAKYYFTTKKNKLLPNGEKWTRKNSIEVIADDYKEAAEYVHKTFGGFDGGYTGEPYLYSRVKVYSVDISSKKALIELRERFARLEAERFMLKMCLDIAEDRLIIEGDFDNNKKCLQALNEIKAIKESFYPF